MAGAGGSAGGTGGGGGAAAPSLCSAWTADLATQNLRALEQQGFFDSRAILEGTLGDRFDQAGSSWARFTIGKVRAGVSSHEGREVALLMGASLHAALGAGASLLVGLNATGPYTSTTLSLPAWVNLAAVVKKDQVAGLPEDVLGFRAWHAPNVLVLRVNQVTDYGFGFELVEQLAGTPPAGGLFVSWDSSDGPFPVRVGDVRLAGFGPSLGNELVELRPNTPEERARALRGIATLAAGGFVTKYRAEQDQARADATTYRLAWSFGRADAVMGVEVTGVAGECCTDAGGTYYLNPVRDVLRGAAPAAPIVTGGHGVRYDDACGDRFLYGLRNVATVLAAALPAYACPPARDIIQSAPSGVLARLDDTPANRDAVNFWLRSAPPLLRLYQGAMAPAGAFTPQSAPAIWSVPMPALTAIFARHQLAVLTIVDVLPQAGGGTTIYARTPFYPQELPTLTNRDVSLFVPCADPRLLQVGSRWVGAVMSSEVYISGTDWGTLLADQRLMLVPGFLFPAEREDLVRTADALTKVAIPRTFGP